MTGERKLDWMSLVNLLPICLDFRDRILRGDEVDLRGVANDVGAALGIGDIDQFAVQKIQAVMGEGLTGAFDPGIAEEIAELFAVNALPIMELMVGFSEGKVTGSGLISHLNDLYFGNAQNMQEVLRRAIGVPDEIASFLAGKFGLCLVSVYSFAAAYKVYERAAQDAALAYEHRLEIERLANEAIAELEKQRNEMESFVESYLLDRLEPFTRGISAMNQAILDDDDDAYIAANAGLWQLFGREAQYKTAEEFDDLMLSEDTFKL